MIAHIWKKDVRRLWPAIAASLVLLDALTWFDCFRSDWIPGAAEAYLNYLVPLAWACLLALAVEQEPIPGDRQFWITRPYRRPELLLAKLAFAAVFIHLPLLLSNACVLAARGFMPLRFLPELLWKHALLAGALTLPAMALASVVRSFAHFVLAAIAVAASFILLEGISEGPVFIWEPVAAVKVLLAVAIGAAGGGVVLAAAYLGRRVLLSRAVAAAAAIWAAIGFAFLLPESALAFRAAVSPARAPLALRLEPPVRGNISPWNGVFLPVSVTGLPSGTVISAEVLRSELIGPDVHYRESMDDLGNPMKRPPYTLGVRLDWGEHPSMWMALYPTPAPLTALRNRTVTIRGELSMTLYRRAPATWIPAGAAANVSDSRRCRSGEVGDAFSGFWFKIECESPAGAPDERIVARVWSPAANRDWRSGLGQFGPRLSRPVSTWLSPINRTQASFEIGAGRYRTDIPRDALPGAKIEITPYRVVGYATVPFEFRGVDLGKYGVSPSH